MVLVDDDDDDGGWMMKEEWGSPVRLGVVCTQLLP